MLMVGLLVVFVTMTNPMVHLADNVAVVVAVVVVVVEMVSFVS